MINTIKNKKLKCKMIQGQYFLIPQQQGNLHHPLEKALLQWTVFPELRTNEQSFLKVLLAR